ncbi:hypothetical protein BLOT_012253 [Blomia tropicalis]|nr:hypothetical protein BLOT_012253 [Blomia tropicalis]
MKCLLNKFTSKHLETIVICSLLTASLTIFLYIVVNLQPSISVFRIAIITLGSTMIGSVLICLMLGYIRSHRKFTSPVHLMNHSTGDGNDSTKYQIEQNAEPCLIFITK